MLSSDTRAADQRTADGHARAVEGVQGTMRDVHRGREFDLVVHAMSDLPSRLPASAHRSATSTRLMFPSTKLWCLSCL